MYKYLFIKETKDTIVILFVVLILGSVVSERGGKRGELQFQREGLGIITIIIIIIMIMMIIVITMIFWIIRTILLYGWLLWLLVVW